jgi:hypothetical protein
VTSDEAALGSMKKELVKMCKKVTVMHGSLSHAGKSDKVVTAQSELSKIEGNILRKVKFIELSMGRLKDVTLMLDEYQRSFQDRDHRFEDLDAHQAELHRVNSVLEEHEKTTSFRSVQVYIEDTAIAIQGIEVSKGPEFEQIQIELDEIREVSRKTIRAVLDRGDKIDDLVAKSALLRQNSKEFYTTVRIPAKALDMVLILLRLKTDPHVVQLCSLCNARVLICARPSTTKAIDSSNQVGLIN